MKHHALLFTLLLCTLPAIAMDEKESTEDALYRVYAHPTTQKTLEDMRLHVPTDNEIHTFYEKTNATLADNNLNAVLSHVDHVAVFMRYYQLYNQRLCISIETNDCFTKLLAADRALDSMQVREISYTLHNQNDLHEWREQFLKQKTRNAKTTLDQSPTETNTLQFLHAIATQMAISDKLATEERVINEALDRNEPMTITIRQFVPKPAFAQRLGTAGIAVIKGIRSFIGV